MKIRDSVLRQLDNPRGYAIIMLSLKVGHTTAYSYIKDNSENLTKAAALKAIREETGLTDAEILEEESEPIKVA